MSRIKTGLVKLAVTACVLAVVAAGFVFVGPLTDDGDERASATGADTTEAGDDPSPGRGETAPAPPSAPSTTVATTTTLAPTTTTEPPPPPEPRFQQGSEGPEVLAIEQRLVELGYWLPGADNTYDFLTSQAIMAFQKYQGIGRDGITGPQTLAALTEAGPAVPRDPSGSHVEIDLERQVMFVVRDGHILTFNTSTGRSGWSTPPGQFTITREINGMRRAELGDLWRPKYFYDGIAIHGSNSIPGGPASHGCARLSNPAMDFLWDYDLLPRGTPVSVY